MVDLLYLGRSKLSDDDSEEARIVVKNADSVEFLESDREVSIVPDVEFDALSLIPGQVNLEPIFDRQSGFSPQAVVRSSARLEVNSQDRVRIPSWAESQPATARSWQISPGEFVYLVGLCARGTDRDSSVVTQVFLLTGSSFFVGIQYYNETVNWVGDSVERLRADGVDWVRERTAQTPTPLHVRVDCLGDVAPAVAETDELLRDTVRDLRPSVQHRVHRELVDSATATPIHEVVEQFDRNRRLRQAYEQSTPALSVTVADDLERVRFKTEEEADLIVDDPALLWDCNCHGDDRSYAAADWETPPTDCPIHGSPDGGAVSEAFASETVRIRHDGVEILWYNSPAVWPPSMDTLRFYHAVDRDLPPRAPSSVLDIGSGTGFLGLALVAGNQPVKRLVSTDWLLQPTLTTAINVANTVQPQWGVETIVKPTFGVEWAADELSPVPNVCVCNPPYLPAVDEHPSLQYDHTVAGTALLKRVVRHAPDLGSSVYVAFSTLAEPEVESVADDSGRDVVELETVTTPFRVPPALADDGYRETLRNRGLRHEPTRRHPYWHDVVFARVEH